MKILEICVVPALGGLELYFHRCCVDLQKRGHEIVSVRLAGSRLEALGIRDSILTESMTRGFRFFPLGNAIRLSGLIEKYQINVVHAHHKDDLPLVALTKSICKKPFKLVFTRQMPLKHQKKDPYHRWLYTRIDLMITITELLKKDALQKLPIAPEKIQRLYYGVNPPPPKDANLVSDFLSISSPGDFNIGVFSRLEFQKGQHLVIGAIARLLAQKIPAKLYIVGDVMVPEYKESLVKQIETLGLQDSVIFKGFLTRPVLAMMGLDVLILPSRNEAFGLVVIEAMRCGVAVLGVNAGGVPEIIDHNKTGMLFEWDNVDQLAGQLEYLYSNPSVRSELGMQGKIKADEIFDSDVHFGKLERLLEVASGNNS